MFAYLLTLLRVAFAYTIPVGVIQAITSQRVWLNVITEVIVGYALPGRPIAMMMLKTWGYTAMTQALAFTADLKHGHYMKVPHHSMLFARSLRPSWPALYNLVCSYGCSPPSKTFAPPVKKTASSVLMLPYSVPRL